VETVSVFARITPANKAGIQLSPKPNFKTMAIIMLETRLAPGPAKRAMGLKMLRKRLISVLMPASNQILKEKVQNQGRI
jgi:hypothetical protein